MDVIDSNGGPGGNDGNGGVPTPLVAVGPSTFDPLAAGAAGEPAAIHHDPIATMEDGNDDDYQGYHHHDLRAHDQHTNANDGAVEHVDGDDGDDVDDHFNVNINVSHPPPSKKRTAEDAGFAQSDSVGGGIVRMEEDGIANHDVDVIENDKPSPIDHHRRRHHQHQEQQHQQQHLQQQEAITAVKMEGKEDEVDRNGQAVGVARSLLTCKVDGCTKLRAKSGYCTRHFKDRSAPIRGPTTDYDKRACIVEGCERLRSKGNYCHRHNRDINAPIRNKSDPPPSASVPSVKKSCKVDGCTRLVVKKGYCSRHFRDSEAPVKKDPPFSFNADERWDELFPQLEAFAKKNGHARVPTSDRSSELARFVIHIRSVYRNKKVKTMKKDPDNGSDPTSVVPDLSQSTLLTPERMEALKNIGFEFQLWTVDATQWENRFQELMEHKKKSGSFHVTSKQNPTLSSWCKTQRQRYKNTMAVYQGMYQVPLSDHLKTGKGEELYKKAKDKAGQLHASGENVALASIHQFSEAKHILDAEKIVKLNAVGFEWDLQKDSYIESWENRYSELMKHKILNGNCRVPKTSPDFPQLGHWVKQMRKYKMWKDEGKSYPSTFTQERIDRLDQLGFEWRLKDSASGKTAGAATDEDQEEVDHPPPLPQPPQQPLPPLHQPHMGGVAAMPVMVDQKFVHGHSSVHNPAYLMGGNVITNMNDTSRQYDMDHNQYQHYRPSQQHGGWDPNSTDV